MGARKPAAKCLAEGVAVTPTARSSYSTLWVIASRQKVTRVLEL